MAKKSLWIDNTTPPTNYIWAKTNEYGEIIGVFEWNGSIWVRIANSTTVIPEGDGTISAVTLNGEIVQIPYSMSAYPGTMMVRTDKGTSIAVTPDGSDPQEIATVELLLWKDV